MENKKSDLRKFCETMWAMTKYSVWPWLAGAAIVGAVIIGLQDAKAKNADSQNAIKTVFQKQR